MKIPAILSLLLAFHCAASAQSWTRCSEGLPAATILSLTKCQNTLFAGTDDVGIFRSIDNGTHWSHIGTNNGDIHAIKIVGNKVFYGTTYSGVYTSDDSGLTFSPNNNGLSYGNMTLPFLVKDFYADAATQQIYAATDIGVFKQSVSIPTKTDENGSTGFQVLVAPNPGNGTFWVRSDRAIVFYSLRSANGAQVLSGSPRCKEFPVNLAGWPDGIYFMLSFDGTRRVCSKIMLSK